MELSTEQSLERPILVVEDDADIRGTFRELLEASGYRVETACHGREAIQVLERSVTPSAIFLDYWMPVMNGRDFLEELKQHPEWADIPVIVFSCNPEKLEGEVGVSASVRKPVDIDDLFEIVAQQTAKSGAIWLH